MQCQFDTYKTFNVVGVWSADGRVWFIVVVVNENRPAIVSRLSLHTLSTQLFDRQVPLMFHHSSLFEICHLLSFSQHSYVHDLFAKIIHISIQSQTYPTARTRLLKLCQLGCTMFPRLLVLPHTIDDPILFQACEECISPFPALRSCCSIWCYVSSILRCFWWRRFGLILRAGEKTHVCRTEAENMREEASDNVRPGYSIRSVFIR